jgi:hypothetical protein
LLHFYIYKSSHLQTILDKKKLSFRVPKKGRCGEGSQPM